MEDLKNLYQFKPSFYIGGISVQTLIFLVISAGLILGFFYVFKRYVGPFLGSRKAIKKASVLAYRLEVLAWTLFSLFGIYLLLSDSLYITLVLLAVVMLAGRNFWRDLFAGIAFRLENKFEVGDPVRFDDHNGVLENISPRNIQIKTDSEELVLVPFRKLSNAIFVKRQAKGKLHSSKIAIPIPNKDADDVVLKITNWIYECPWAVNNEKVNAKVISENEIAVTVYAVDILSINKTEEYLKKRLKEIRSLILVKPKLNCISTIGRNIDDLRKSLYWQPFIISRSIFF